VKVTINGGGWTDRRDYPRANGKAEPQIGSREDSGELNYIRWYDVSADRFKTPRMTIDEFARLVWPTLIV